VTAYVLDNRILGRGRQWVSSNTSLLSADRLPSHPFVAGSSVFTSV